MRKCLFLLVVLLLTTISAVPQTGPKAAASSSIDTGNGYVVPGASWEHVTPEAAGFSSGRLEVLRAWLKTHPTTAMMAVYKGKVIFEYGDTARVSNIASVRKSILDILYGVELKTIKQDINSATVVQLGLQDKVPFIHPEDYANFDQLLTSRSGIYIPNGDGDQDAIAPRRGSEYPGAHFFYNNWDFNALGTLFEKLTDKNIYDALRDDLAIPLQMQDFDRDRQKKTVYPDHAHPLYPMWLSTRDMARIGLLMISSGKWGGKQLADAGFLSWSTSIVTPFSEINPTLMRNAGLPQRWGYGRLWWVWDAPVFPGNIYIGPYQGAYTAMGTGGQYITVFPMIDLVVVHKVDIDADHAANMSQLGYQVALDMLLDAHCSGACK
jgi:hypothetical protein